MNASSPPMIGQGDPCPVCSVPVYASARFLLPAGCIKAVFRAVASVVTVTRGGVGAVQFGDYPTVPVPAVCINCGARVIVEPTPRA